MSNTIPNDYSDAPWNQAQNQPRPDKSPKLRRASNNFKHGLYSQTLAFNTPSEHDLYANILHDFVEEYRPIGPSECGLVQQLASLQFRFQKVQSLYAEAMRLEVLAQCKNASPDAEGNAPTERTIETRAFMALAKDPSFHLFTRELDRLPTRIQRVMRRLHETIKLRHDALNWPDLPATPIISKKASAPAEPLKVENSETTAKTKGSNAIHNPIPPEMAHLQPPPILTKEKFWSVWPKLKPTTQELLLNGDPADYRRRAFFKWTLLDESNFHQWLHEGPDQNCDPGLLAA